MISLRHWLQIFIANLTCNAKHCNLYQALWCTVVIINHNTLGVFGWTAYRRVTFHNNFTCSIYVLHRYRATTATDAHLRCFAGFRGVCCNYTPCMPRVSKSISDRVFIHVGRMTIIVTIIIIIWYRFKFATCGALTREVYTAGRHRHPPRGALN